VGYLAARPSNRQFRDDVGGSETEVKNPFALTELDYAVRQLSELRLSTSYQPGLRADSFHVIGAAQEFDF
jgi:hypothetical protein